MNGTDPVAPDPQSHVPRRRGRPANTSTDATVATVLVAARRSFAARGYAGTTNREIASRAGLAHTAIYNHFGSKAQLFTAVFIDVQDQLIVELDRSVSAAPDRPPFPAALLDAIEGLRLADPSYVEFLASMYVEVRRHDELRDVFQGGADFPIVNRLIELSAGSTVVDSSTESGGDADLWFWVAFALGLAQLGALADADAFSATLNAFRRELDPGPSHIAPSLPDSSHTDPPDSDPLAGQRGTPQ